MFDLHNHILPGLDDGASDWEESLEMARIALADGIKVVVCTPHYQRVIFENMRPKIMEVFEEFREKLRENDIPLDIFPGAELRLDTGMAQRIDSEELLSINDTRNYALIELPPETMLHNMDDILWDLKSQGITPVLAHPERVRCFQSEPTRIFDMVRMGALVQLTAASLLGLFGTETRKFSLFLIEHRLAHVIATDAHGASERRPRLAEAYNLVRKLAGETIANQLICEIPAQIVRGEPVFPEFEPIPIRRRSFFGIPFFKCFSAK
jgi:protein-tyrosine phosphatase